jgi:hypothetical protein
VQGSCKVRRGVTLKARRWSLNPDRWHDLSIKNRSQSDTRPSSESSTQNPDRLPQQDACDLAIGYTHPECGVTLQVGAAIGTIRDHNLTLQITLTTGGCQKSTVALPFFSSVVAHFGLKKKGVIYCHKSICTLPSSSTEMKLLNTLDHPW